MLRRSLVITCEMVLCLNITEHPESEYEMACLLMVFVAVSIPKLARIEQKTIFVASVEGKFLLC